MIRKLIIGWLLLGLLFVLPTIILAQVAVERSSEIVTIGAKQYYMHHVKAGETLYGISTAYQVSVEEIERLNPEVKEGLKADAVIGIPVVETQTAPATVQEGDEYVVQQGENLYDIAKKFGIDLSDFKALNPGLTNDPKAGTVIQVPDIINEDDYIVHKVEFNERTSTLLKRWKVSESEFREKNVSSGSRVFVNQTVLIPIEPVRVNRNPVVVDEGEDPQQMVEEPQEGLFVEEEPFVQPECDILPENASKRYRVALMIPLYLYDIGKLDVNKEDVAQTRKSRSLSFLQYYEGFMMAVDSLTRNEGLKLDLTVIDVTESVSSAEEALSQIRGKDIDLIVGPFFGKSFDVVERYAKEHDIVMVNPLSTRESILEDNPNVVKIKPSATGQILCLSNLVKNRYRDSNVFIVSRENESDSLLLTILEQQLNKAVNEEVTIPNEEFLQYARSESQRMEMGEKMVSTVSVEGQIYSTNDLKAHADGDVVLQNPVKRYAYSDIGELKSQLSGVRNNLIVAYGDDNVFATQVLNTLMKNADKMPITLVALPDWTKFEKLLVDNLLGMNAIYFSDFFVDYRDETVKRFVLGFRERYQSEPQAYAFEGYDVACYFLNALMRYGRDMLDCVPYYSTPLLHTQYHFMKKGSGNGLENQSWSIYQYDKEAIELNPINPFEKNAEE